jgi:hypothetical protein
VGNGTWVVDWKDGEGGSGVLSFGSAYASPTLLPVNTGLTLALYSGSVQKG